MRLFADDILYEKRLKLLDNFILVSFEYELYLACQKVQRKFSRVTFFRIARWRKSLLKAREQILKELDPNKWSV